MFYHAQDDAIHVGWLMPLASLRGRGVHYATETFIASSTVWAVKHTLPAKCVLNVLFLVADFQPSRCVETHSRAVFYTSDRNGVELVSHGAAITVSNRVSNQSGLKLCIIY